MEENLITTEPQPFENMTVQDKITTSFTENKLLIDKKDYDKLKYYFGKVSKKTFDKSTIKYIYPNNFAIIFFCVLSGFFSFSFYLCLLTFVLTFQFIFLLYSFILYILGTVVQLFTIPQPKTYLTREEFDDKIKKILNCSVPIKLLKSKNEKSAMFQAKYTNDITGVINIPNDVKYVKISGIQLYSNKNELNKLIKNFEWVYKSVKVDYKLMYENEVINNFKHIYALDSTVDLYSINFFNRITAILLIHWVYALYTSFIANKKYLDLYPAKLLSEEESDLKTQFSVHGKNIDILPNIVVPLESNEEFERDYEEYEREVERKKEEEKERLRKKREKEAELKRNTKVLSIFKNSDNFKIKVTKVYSSVNLRLDAYTPDRHHWYTSYLGEYDENIDEKIETKDKMTIYRPKGIDVRIEVIRSVYSYTISIGDDFSENYSYRHHY